MMSSELWTDLPSKKIEKIAMFHQELKMNFTRLWGHRALTVGRFVLLQYPTAEISFTFWLHSLIHLTTFDYMFTTFLLLAYIWLQCDLLTMKWKPLSGIWRIEWGIQLLPVFSFFNNKKKKKGNWTGSVNVREAITYHHLCCLCFHCL